MKLHLCRSRQRPQLFITSRYCLASFQKSMGNGSATLNGNKGSYTMNIDYVIGGFAVDLRKYEAQKSNDFLRCSRTRGGLAPLKAKAATDGDKKFLAIADQSDQNEIALAKLAEQKATNPAVKAFAEKMIT